MWRQRQGAGVLLRARWRRHGRASAADDLRARGIDPGQQDGVAVRALANPIARRRRVVVVHVEQDANPDIAARTARQRHDGQSRPVSSHGRIQAGHQVRVGGAQAQVVPPAPPESWLN
jgi:hypothetical protein